MREIADPQTVGRRGCEVTVDEVPRPLGLPVRDCRAPLLASDRALKAGLLHQAFDGAAGDVDAFAAQRPPHLAHAIDAEVLGVNLADALDQLGVALSLSAGIAPASLDLVIGGWGDLERLADRLDPVLVAKGIDHRAHLLGCGSSSRAKKVEAAFRISFALRSSRTSRSRSLMRSASVLETPARSPWSISARGTHLRSVSWPMPHFCEIERIAAHSLGYSSRCSSTRRTARWRTSNGYRLPFLIGPSCHWIGPPRFPERFMAHFSTALDNLRASAERTSRTTMAIGLRTARRSHS